MRMQQLMTQVKYAGNKVKSRLKRRLQDERGEIGIKQLAITVGVIIIVGAAVIVLKDSIGDIIESVWDWLFDIKIGRASCRERV